MQLRDEGRAAGAALRRSWPPDKLPALVLPITGGRRQAELLRAQGQCQAAGRGGRALSLLLSIACAFRLAAQARIFPRVPSFELPQASPRVHGLVGRLISARRGDSEFGREPEAEVAVGENFPVLALRRGPRPVTLGFGTQVYGRFSLGRPEERPHQQRLGRRPQHDGRARRLDRSPARSTTRAATWATSTATGSAPAGSTGPAKWRRPGSRTARGRCGSPAI